MPQPPARQFSGIFVCYRREDASGHAGRLFDRLNAHFGDEQVFMDIDHIEPGENFVRLIEKNVGSCEILLALIGHSWLTSRDEGGRRLDSAKDFVRLEIAAALASQVRVIPVLVQGAHMPRPKDLPEDLLPLLELHAVELSDLRWKHDVDELIGFMEGVLTTQRETQRRKAQKDAVPHQDTDPLDPVFWEQQRKEVQEKRRAEEVQREREEAKERQKREAEAAERRRRSLLVILVLVGALMLAVVLVNIVIPFIRRQGQSEQYSTNQAATPTSTQQTGRMASPSPTKTTSQTSPGLQQTEAEVGEETAAQQEEPKKQEVWHVAMIDNKTNVPMTYQILLKGSWKTFTLPPAYHLVHAVLNEDSIDVKYKAGFQEKQYSLLQATTVVGHEPTESEKQKAPIYYFIVENGDIVMHRQP